MARDPEAAGVEHQARGRGKLIEGKTSEVAGAVQGDTSQEMKGKAEKNIGKAQEKMGEAAEDMSRG